MSVKQIKIDKDTKGLSESSIETLSATFDIVTGTPIPSFTIGLLKSFKNFRDYLFAKRLVIFLQTVEALKGSERIELTHALEKRDGSKAGEILLELINSMDDDEKVKLLTVLAKAVAYKKLEIEEFYRFGHIIKSVYYSNLLRLSEFGYENYIPSVSESLFTHGLIVQATINESKLGKEGGFKYTISKSGRHLNKFIQQARKQNSH